MRSPAASLVVLAATALGFWSGCVDLAPPRVLVEQMDAAPRPDAVPGTDVPAAGAPPADPDAGLDAAVVDASPDDGAEGDGPADTLPEPDMLPPDAPLSPNGAACAAGATCASGFCVDGVCCQSDCKDVCHACNLPGSGGVCAPVSAAQDPRDDCPQEPGSSCGRDGVCNGLGACRLHAAGTPCAAQTCAAGVESSARTCDGQGACRPATTKPCAPYACAGAVCAMACSGPNDCEMGSTCVGSKCTGLLAAGSPCTDAGTCLSGRCVDGVCCQTACTEACHACNLPGAVGTCTPIPAGQDPGNECDAQPASTCGTDGACDGNGGCRKHEAGTVCQVGSCSGATETLATTCDGAGTCRTAVTRSCGGYFCAGTACGTSCSGQAQCQEGYACASGGCAEVNATGLIGYWRFDDGTGGTAKDSSGNGLAGTLMGYAAGYKWRADGKLGGALEFSGEQWVKVSWKAVMDGITAQLTLAAWIKRTPGTSGAVIQRQAGTSNKEHYQFQASKDAGDPIKAYLNSHQAPPGGLLCSAALPGGVTSDVWHHVVVTYDGTAGRVYVNGVLKCTDNRTLTFGGYAPRPLTIGAQLEFTSDDGVVDHYNGLLDEVMLWSRALSAAEVQQLYQGAQPKAR